MLSSLNLCLSGGLEWRGSTFPWGHFIEKDATPKIDQSMVCLKEREKRKWV
jgi:hypothetical protein